jgi:hypothetical protein
MRLHSLIALFLVAGCAPSYTWNNPSVSSAEASRQFEIDKAECTAFAIQSIPVPPQSTYQPPVATTQPSYSVSGSVTIYDANGNMHFGQYSGMAHSSAPINYLQQIETGEQTAQESARRDEAFQAQDNLAEACLLKRGWQKVPTAQ